MAIKGTILSSWVYFQNNFQTLGNFTENAIISNFHNLISNQIQKF